MPNGILVVCEIENGAIKSTALELVGKARSIAQARGVEVVALVIGSDQPRGVVGADRAFHVGGPDFGTFTTGAWVKALQTAISEVQPAVVLGTGTTNNREVFPRLAARLGLGLATDVVDLREAGGQVFATRPVYAGKALMDVTVTSTPAMFMARPNSFPVPAGLPATAVQALPVTLGPADRLVAVVETKAPQSTVADLTEAITIVSGGRALKDKATFDKVIRPLADAFRATPGASRAAVDAGFAPSSDQVGQTGKTVNPNLYVAVGISGAIQHLAGMRTSKVIVAINKDPEAPIFQFATYGIVGDLFAIAPLLEAKVKTMA